MAIDFVPLKPKIDFVPLDGGGGGGGSQAQGQPTLSSMAMQAAKETGSDVWNKLQEPMPVIGGALASAQSGLTNAANDAEKYYGADTTMGKVAGKGGRLLASAIPVSTADAMLQALAGPLLEGAGAVIKPVGKVAGDIASEIIAHVSSSTPEAVKAVFERPAIMKQARQLIGQAEQSNLVNTIETHINKLGSVIKDFETEFAKFAERDPANLPTKIDAHGIVQKVSDNLVGSGYNIPKELSGVEPRLIDRVSTSERDEIVKNLKVLRDNPNMNWGDALNFKRQLDDAINYPSGGGLTPRGDSAQHALKMIRAEVKEALTQALPEDKRGKWTGANMAFHDAMDAFDALKRNAVGTDPEKTASKLVNRLRKGYQDIGINDQAAKIGDGVEKALRELEDKVSANTFKHYVSGWGAGGFAKVLPTSPAVLGWGTAGAGKFAQLAQAVSEQIAKNPIATRAALQSAKKNQEKK